jgi:hypothetical protein
VADYAQFLTGQAAADAAEAAGDESPPPNDYYVVNANPRLRTLPLAATVIVRLTTEPGVGPLDGGYASSVTELSKILASDTEETASLRANGYWLTLVNGVVTRIEEQYTP